jgi:hypothetical protein
MARLLKQWGHRHQGKRQTAVVKHEMEKAEEGDWNLETGDRSLEKE